MEEHRFDELAKALAEGVSRREALRRFAGGLAGALLASLGLKPAGAQTVVAAPTVMPPSNQTAIVGFSQLFNLGSVSEINPTSGFFTVGVNWGDSSPATVSTVPPLGSLGTESLGTQPHTYANSGTFTVTVTVTDSATNLSGSGSFMVQVCSCGPPTITCPPDTTVGCGSSTDPSIGPQPTGVAIATSPCGLPVTITYHDESELEACPKHEAIHRGFTATDTCAQTAFCSQLIDIVDQGPTIMCPPSTTVAGTATGSGTCQAAVPDLCAVATPFSACGSDLKCTQSPAAGTTVTGPGTLPITLSVADICNLSASCTTSLTVICPSSEVLTVSIPTGPSTAVVNQPVIVQGSFTGPGPIGAYQAKISWGDGTSTPVLSFGSSTAPAVNVPLSGTHSYSTNGTFPVVAEVTDMNGDMVQSSAVDVTVTYDYDLEGRLTSGQPARVGSVIPIVIQLRDFHGVNQSSPNILVQAVAVEMSNSNEILPVLSPGNANLGGDFRFDPTLPGYIFNLDTKNLVVGAWHLDFTVNGQSDSSYRISFIISCSDSSQCPAGMACCNGVCTDTLTNFYNCGSCNKSCVYGETCCFGTCTDTRSDPNHCGNCETSCSGTCGTCLPGHCDCSPTLGFCPAGQTCKDYSDVTLGPCLACV